MHSIEEWQLRAIREPRRAFIDALPGFFLIKRPEIAPPAASTGKSGEHAIDFETISSVQLPTVGEGPDESFAWEWRIAPIEKKEGNPFPDRISVGRAPNCDIAIRLAFISKLHAHFIPKDDGTCEFVDLRPANGTSVNGRQLGPGERVTLNPGDSVWLGTLALELVDAERLYDLLLGEARR